MGQVCASTRHASWPFKTRNTWAMETIVWKLNLKSNPNKVFDLITTPSGIMKFWSENAARKNGRIHFWFPNGQDYRGRILLEIQFILTKDILNLFLINSGLIEFASIFSLDPTSDSQRELILIQPS